jgi:regulator of replication initiation timing
MTARICRTEKFIPRNGNPVFQVQEEADFGGTLQLLPPRVPTAKELADQQDAFGAAQQLRIAELETELASTKQSLEAKTQEASTLTTERDSLRVQLDAANESLAEKTSELATANGVITEKDARIAQLIEGLPWNPRIMETSAFIARITQDELLKLATSTDPNVQGIVAMLGQWKANDWPIILDSPEMVQAIGYLGKAGMVAPERVAELLRDCSRSEAHIADQST